MAEVTPEQPSQVVVGEDDKLEWVDSRSEEELREALERAEAYRIRLGNETDRAFVVSTWSQGYWKGSLWGHRVRWQQFGPRMRVICDGILQHATVMVACPPDDHEEILGYIVFQRHWKPPKGHPEPIAGGLDLFHFAYVKPFARLKGVFRALLVASGLPDRLRGVIVTCPTRLWFSNSNFRGLDARFPATIHDPFLPMYYLRNNPFPKTIPIHPDRNNDI